MSSVSLPLLDTIGIVGAAVVVMVDGRRAVAVTAIAAALTLAPTAAAVAGAPGAALLFGTACGAAILGSIAEFLARHLTRRGGLDPIVPIFAPREALFGPRSIRAAGGALLLPAASWVSFNFPVGIQTAVAGLLLPAAYLFLCAVLRVFVARTIEDLAVGIACGGLAAAGGWILREGASGMAVAMAPALLAPVAAVATAWLSGRSTPLPEAAAG